MSGDALMTMCREAELGVTDVADGAKGTMELS